MATPHLLRGAFAVLAFGLGTAAGCFLEPEAPPTFRFDCDSDSDCPEEEVCMSGLCQRPCTLATAGDDCPSESYATCINGACATLCDTSADEDPCPEPQSCNSAALGGDESDFGLCSQACTADSCPDSETCVEGFCVQLCDVDDPDCAPGSSCVVGVCIPDAVGGEGGGFP